MSLEAGLLGAALALTSALSLSLSLNHPLAPRPNKAVTAHGSATPLASVCTQAATARQWAMKSSAGITALA